MTLLVMSITFDITTFYLRLSVVVVVAYDPSHFRHFIRVPTVAILPRRSRSKKSVENCWIKGTSCKVAGPQGKTAREG